MERQKEARKDGKHKDGRTFKRKERKKKHKERGRDVR